MSGTSPARAAYEAYWRRITDTIVTPWGDAIPPAEREAWDAAVKAAIDTRQAQADETVYAECDALRALAAEILGEFGASKGDGYRARIGQVKYQRYRERAGLEDQK